MSETDAIAERIVAQLHRRQTHFDRALVGAGAHVRVQVDGELIGLRSALGLALGFRPPEDVAAGRAFYDGWVSTLGAQFGACSCGPCVTPAR